MDFLRDEVATNEVNLYQAMSGLWDEFGSEITLLALFCAGFALFRVATICRLLPGSNQGRRSLLSSKALAKKKLAAESCFQDDDSSEYSVDAATRTPSSRSLSKSEDLGRSELRRRTSNASLSSVSTSTLDPGSSSSNSSRVRSTLHALSSRVEAGVRNQDVSALQEILETQQAGFLQIAERLTRRAAAIGDNKGVETMKSLTEAGYEPQEPTLVAVISLCAESKHVRLAEHCFRYWRNKGYKPSLALCCSLMKVYSQTRQWKKTCDLYETMQAESIQLDTVAYGSVIKAAVEGGNSQLAARLYEASGNPDLVNRLSLIRAAGRERDVPRALRLLEELEQSGLSVDVSAYNCALEACVTCQAKGSTEKLFRKMLDKNCVDVVSYNTYLKALLRENARDEVAFTFASMRERALAPNVVTYNSLIRDACSRQDGTRAWQFVDAMEQAGVPPDAFTCSILMKTVKQSGSGEGVDRILALMKRARVAPDEVLLNSLLDAAVRLRDMNRLTQVLEQSKASGLAPSVHSCAMLIRAYGHAHQLDKAWELYRAPHQQDTKGEQDDTTAAMIEACLASGDLEAACSLFKEASLGSFSSFSSFARAPSTFGAIVKAAVLQKRALVAVQLYEETKATFSCGRVTFNTMLDSLVRSGDVVRASTIFRDMTLRNVMPDLISFTTLIRGHCARGDLEQALQLLGLMQRRGIAPDAVLFNSILDGCAHRQMRTLTETVLADMEANKIAPSSYTLSILVKLYSRCNDLDAAFQVVEVYPKKYRFTANAQVYTALISACISNNDLARAEEVFNQMPVVGAHHDAKAYQTLLAGATKFLSKSESTQLDRCGSLILKLLRNALAANLASQVESEVLDAALSALHKIGLTSEASEMRKRLSGLRDPRKLRSAGQRASDFVNIAANNNNNNNNNEQSSKTWSPPPPPTPPSRAPRV